MGFSSGMNGARFKLTQDAAKVGACRPGEAIDACTGGGNEWNGDLHSECMNGLYRGQKIKCTNNRITNNPPTSAADGTVRAFDGAPVVADAAFIPQIARGGKWMGVCGNGFSSNDNAPTIMCKQLGFDKGMRNGWFTLTQNAVSVGKCLPGEAITACTAGYNDFEGKKAVVNSCLNGPSGAAIKVKCTN